ncbi:MAG: VCBS repeat-containing protein, partial [Planctomycetaceae bacterium]|nr:VCBS repeat-containing protein [Planctomycetaceae bacterium]
MKRLFRSAAAIAAMCLCSCGKAADTVRLRLTITSPMPYSNTPLDPQIDFAEFIRTAAVAGVLDPNSIEIRDATTDEIIPHAITEDFAYSDKARLEFVASDSNQREFEIRFRTVDQRPALQPKKFTPQIGVGDLLRFNASQPRPVSIPYSPGLHDINGDGRLDLTGTWNYAYRPGWPWDGIVVFPRTNSDSFEFGDLNRLRYVTSNSDEPQFFTHTYMGADFADFDKDGKLDLVMTRRGTKSADFYLNTGQQDASGLPHFEPAASVRVNDWQACRVVDLNGDGALDLVVDGEYLRNENPDGWPFRAANSVRLNAGRKPCFLDIDQDGQLDAVCLHGADSVQPDFYRIAWKKNLGGNPPNFGEHELLNEIDASSISLVSAWSDGNESGLIVQHDAFQQLSFYELLTDNVPEFQQRADEQKLVRPTPVDDTEKIDNDTSGRRFRRIGRA